MWLCKCECGAYKTERGSRLNRGDVQSCGCFNRETIKVRMKHLAEKNKKTLVGKKFTRLTVMHETDFRSTDGQIMWHCKCDCGNEVDVKTTSLTNNQTHSCGCYAVEMRNAASGCVDGTKVSSLKQKKSSNNTSGTKGVKWNKSVNKWQSQIDFKKTRYHLGVFDDIEEAIQARKIAEEKLFGDFLEWYNNEFKKLPKEKQEEMIK